MTAADRLFKRFAPLAYDDPNQGGVFQSLVGAWASVREIAEVARDTDTHVAWGTFYDPATCPSELLDLLALISGVVLPASTLTDDEKRYRITQAAGLYRGTPRALVEELLLVLEGTKTVYLGYHDGDEWHYAVGTLAAETPDGDAVDSAIEDQNPLGMTANHITTDDWVWLFVSPDLVAHRATVDGVDTYVIGEPDYPTWQDVLDHFSTWQHLIDNDPDL